ncbi:MAG: hypothetical protein IH867_06300 [Chloroflexi bacterium]|nr:hypothetical protein [Chloroflexota bacterium]
MKLSVKLLSGLAFMALVAVAVIGLSNSASAAVDGKVYITSVGSSFTNEPDMNLEDDDRVTTNTVYGTFDSLDITGINARDIVNDAEKFIVTIVDSDLNQTLTISDSAGGSGFDTTTVLTGTVELVFNAGGSLLNAVGDKVRLFLLDSPTSQIVGDIDDILILITGTKTEVVGVRIDAFFEGGGTSGTPPWVVLEVTSGIGPGGNVDIEFPTSTVETITATIKSVRSVGTVTLNLKETGLDTGRFEGFVTIIAFVSGAVETETGEENDPNIENDPATIAAGDGSITITYIDAETDGTATDVKRTSILQVDTTIPTLTFSSPIHDTESQNRLPSFAGNASDAQSGLDISSFALVIDRDDDETNDVAGNKANAAINPTDGSFDGNEVVSIDTSLLGDDGDSTISFNYTETNPLPGIDFTPDHLVDFQLTMNDIAGNIGYSDSDTSEDEFLLGRHGRQPHVIKIDQKIPAFTDDDAGAAFTGVAYDSALEQDDEDAVRDSIKLIFDGNLKATSISPSDFLVIFSGAGGTFVPAAVLVIDNLVYLDIDSTIPSDNEPEIKIQGTIQDLAGNSTDSGSIFAEDSLEPVITVTLSGGSGTGTDDEAADGLTDDEMVVTISTDEDLLGPPTVVATNTKTDESTVEIFSGSAIAQGGNVWQITLTKKGSSTGEVEVEVSVDDIANNTATGDASYDLDTTLADPTVSPGDGDAITQSNPFITTTYTNETSSVTVVEALFNDVDVTSQIIASADNKTFFFQPLTALANVDDHTFSIESIDAAGNENTFDVEFEKSDRSDFEIELFAGWNLVSVPSNPLVTDIGSVMSNTGIKQVVAFDATTPSQPWRIASKVGSGSYSSQTTPGLTTITAGPGYWIETSNFETQEIALEGEAGPGDARPGLTTIATNSGWNLVGVVDQSRKQTQDGDKGQPLTRPKADGSPGDGVTVATYFNTVNNGRSYVFDTVKSQFNELAGADIIEIGAGIWVFVSPQTGGDLPPIVP